MWACVCEHVAMPALGYSLFYFAYFLSIKDIILQENCLTVQALVDFFLLSIGAVENVEVRFTLCFLPTLFLCNHAGLFTDILREGLCHIL